MYQLRVVPQLWINHFDILRIPLHEQALQILEAPLYISAELSDSHTLTCTDFPIDFVSHYQNRDIQVISTLANTVSHLVNLTDLAQELVPQIVVLIICSCIQNASSQSLLAFIPTHLLHDPYSLCDMSTGICFNCHQFCHISLLIDRPVLIELFEESLDFSPVSEKLFW